MVCLVENDRKRHIVLSGLIFISISSFFSGFGIILLRNSAYPIQNESQEEHPFLRQSVELEFDKQYNLILGENEIQFYRIFGSKGTYVVLHIYDPPEYLQFAYYYNTLIMQGYSSFSSDSYNIKSFRMVSDGWIYLYCYHAAGMENSTINYRFKLYYVEDQGQVFYPDVY